MFTIHVDKCNNAGTNNCSHNCIDTIGGYFCLCPNGYNLQLSSNNFICERKVSSCTEKLLKPFSHVYVRDKIRITRMMTKNWHTYAYLNTYIDEMAGSQKHSILDFVWSCGPPLVDQSNLRLCVCTMFW